MENFRGTTICSVRRGNLVVMGGDGQVTLGNTVMKANARKVRRLYKDRVIAGFAGATADAFTLFERFEGKLEKHSGHLVRAAVEMAKDWRTDRTLRRLEALLAIADENDSLLISGTGDVIQPEHGLIAIGSGGPYAQAAAMALIRNTELDAEEITRQALGIAARHLHLYQLEPDHRNPRDQHVGANLFAIIFLKNQSRMNSLLHRKQNSMSQMTPREIVQELDKHIIGQSDAKRAVAIALRNRWRRMQVDEDLRAEITPKNILMIGPTGVGKTEIARRLAQLANAPFIKVEATKFTEVGYVGKDVESIIRDLVDTSVKMTREQAMARVRSLAEDAAYDRIIGRSAATAAVPAGNRLCQ